MKNKIYKISIEEVVSDLNIDDNRFPKYTRQILNLANQNSGGTRPRNVGQLSDLFPKYRNKKKKTTVDGWKNWYVTRYPNSKEIAVNKIQAHVKKLKTAINKINKEMISDWAEELLFDKTFIGMQAQYFVLADIAKKIGAKKFHLANAEQESKNIDGYIDGVAYQIKPKSYDFKKKLLPVNVECKLVIYSKKNTCITYYFVENNGKKKRRNRKQMKRSKK